ncbi:MAG: flp pilus-assembly TadE/G-like family protein [Actinomycetota bacterium]|nr:flp pilus-assembly TadE/G-like family protein [Actinomycetota bacterium]
MTPVALGGAANRAGQRGSATVLVLALCMVVVAAGAGSLALVHVVSARHRAGAAADLAALGASTRGRAGEHGAACTTAAELAASAGARLVRCERRGDDVFVVAEVDVRGWLPGLGPARVPARAGPGPGPRELSGAGRGSPGR